jgi:chorismate mutase
MSKTMRIDSCNEKLSGLVAKRDHYVAEQRAKQPRKPGDSFDRSVEETLKAQLRR